MLAYSENNETLKNIFKKQTMANYNNKKNH